MPEIDLPPAKLPPGPHQGRRAYSRKPPASGQAPIWDTDRKAWVPGSPAGAGDAPAGAKYLTTESDPTLTAEVVVGTSPGGELGGSWASPTVDGTHSGSAHHAEAHNVASHSDTTGTGAELDTLTDGSDADALHDHATLATAAEAVTAVKAEDPLALAGDVTIAGGKSLAVDTIAEKTGAAGVGLDDCLALDDDFYLGAAKQSSDVKLGNSSGILNATRGDGSTGGITTGYFITTGYNESTYFRFPVTEPSEKTLSGDAFTQTSNFHKLQPEVDTSPVDDLANINPVTAIRAHFLFLKVSDDADTITIKHEAGGNYDISCAGGQDIVLSGNQDIAILIYDFAALQWYCLASHAESHDYDTHTGGVPYAELEYDDATSDPLPTHEDTPDDGAEDSAARKDHVHALGGAAGGDLGGTYPNPTVDDGADSTAIHDNVAGEIAAITEKATPVANDEVAIEDSADSNNKKSLKIGNIDHDTISAGTIAAHDTGATGAELDTLTDGSDAEALHIHGIYETPNIVIDGGGADITTGVKVYVRFSSACTVIGWGLGGDNAANEIVLDVWLDSHANYPPTVADTMVGGGNTKPILDGAIVNEDDPVDWDTTAIPAGYWLGINVDSVGGTKPQRVTLSLKVQRT